MAISSAARRSRSEALYAWSGDNAPGTTFMCYWSPTTQKHYKLQYLIPFGGPGRVAVTVASVQAG